MKTRSRGKRWRILFALAPMAVVLILAILTSGSFSAAGFAYSSGGSAGCAGCGPVLNPGQYGLENDMLFIANGRASNVAVIDVAQMSMVDYIPVPRSPINTAAAAGQLGATLDKSIRGLGVNAPVSVPDMFYWELHGVVPSADRGSVYAIGALAMTDSDFTMYQVNTKTHNNTRKIPLAPSVVGYCGLEYDRNDESSGVLYAENMQTGPADLASLTGLPLQFRDPLAGLLPALGLGGLFNSVENQASLGVGGISEENLASGTNTRYIATDYNSDGASSTCGIAWDASGNNAFVSQMFQPLIDTLDWNTKTVNGEILPPTPYRGNTQHQSTSAKTRDLLITADGVDGVAIYSMGLKTLVGQININSMAGHVVAVHGVEIAPNNDSIIYVLGDGSPTGMFVVDIANINAPKLIGGLEAGFDGSACGTYAIPDKQNYYRAAGKCEKPNLSMSKTGSFWENYAAYQNRELSVNFTIGTSGNVDARNVIITDIQNTNGVTVAPNQLPIMVGEVSSTMSATTTVKYNVPPGVSSFRTSPTATAESPCGDTYTYPGSGGVGVPPAPRA